MSSNTVYQSAAQPDIIRAAQKDDLYLQLAVESTFEVVRSFLGPAAAMRWAREATLLAQVMYYSTTTGIGNQTLGEEYCDVLQATSSGDLPELPRRIALVLLQAVAPYLADRASRVLGGGTCPGAWPDLDQDWHSLVAADTACPSTSCGEQHTWVEAARQLGASVRSWLHPHMPAIREVATAAARLNLALFYVHGAYYEVSKRLSATALHSTRAPGTRHPSYRLLGVLLLAQLATSAGFQLVPLLPTTPLSTPPSQPAAVLPDPPFTSQPHPTQSLPIPHMPAAPSPPPSRIVATPGGSGSAHCTAASAGTVLPVVVTAGKQCPLCLSPRNQPTSTPCGHVFCWTCITQWCVKKPECPLCRGAVVPQQLVCTCHADL